MSVLDKFSGVEIKADRRISEQDKLFCQKNQEAYNKSGEGLKRLAKKVSEIEAEQELLLREPGASDFYSPYTGGYNSGFSVSKIYDVLQSRHRTFIQRLVEYFQRTYHVELDSHEIIEHLLPERPTCGLFDARVEEFNLWDEKMNNLSLRYEVIIDEIFTQLGGFSFTERAMNELLENCWDATHGRVYGKEGIQEKFEIKKSTLRLTGYFCHCNDESWRSNPAWKPNDSLRTVLKAISHFESGLMNDEAEYFSPFFRYDVEINEFEYPYLQKIKSIKLFKNGRVDIHFSDPTTLYEFVEKYLRNPVGNTEP